MFNKYFQEQVTSIKFKSGINITIPIDRGDIFSQIGKLVKTRENIQNPSSEEKQAISKALFDGKDLTAVISTHYIYDILKFCTAKKYWNLEFHFC